MFVCLCVCASLCFSTFVVFWCLCMASESCAESQFCLQFFIYLPSAIQLVFALSNLKTFWMGWIVLQTFLKKGLKFKNMFKVVIILNCFTEACIHIPLLTSIFTEFQLKHNKYLAFKCYVLKVSRNSELNSHLLIFFFVRIIPAHVFPLARSKIEFAHKFSKNDNKNDKGSSSLPRSYTSNNDR